MNVSQAAAAAAIAAVGARLNSGTMVLYSGAMPASPETALSGNTALATFNFAATAFGAGSYTSPDEQAVATFTSGSVSPAAGGTAIFARNFQSGGTAEEDMTVSAPWYGGMTAIVGQMNTNGGNLYKCTTAGTAAATGGPTGTGSGIVDGTITWAYVAAGTADVTLGNVVIQIGVNVAISGFTLKLPAV